MPHTSISIAYSPDTDDAFMIWALKEKRISWGPFDFTFISDDIETLNRQALTQTYDVTAISVAAWPHFADRYVMIPVGGSTARSKGPAIVTRMSSGISSLTELAMKRVAVPGLKTSAALAAKILLPNICPVPLPFHQIANAVQSAECEAGILIHELQMDAPSANLRVLGHLGDLWISRYRLPLPLGTNAIRRSLGDEMIAELVGLLRASVDWALSHREEAIEYARHAAVTLTDAKAANQYIDRFVNNDSLAIQTDVQSAVTTMFDLGTECGHWASPPPRPYFFDFERRGT